MVVAAHDGQDVTAVAEETRANLKLFWTAADSVAPGDPYEQPRTLPSWAPCENPYRVPRPLIDLESNDLKTPAEFERVVTP